MHARARCAADDASPTQAEIERDWRSCWQKPFVTLISSYHCDATWRQLLSGSDIKRIDVVEAPGANAADSVDSFDRGPRAEVNNGLVMLTLETGEVSLFKPCGLGAMSEAAAYHVDRLVGFQRTPAAVTRAWSVVDAFDTSFRSRSRQRLCVDSNQLVAGLCRC